MTCQPNWKPTSLDVEQRRYERKQLRKAAKDTEKRARVTLLSRLRREAFARDGGRCRVYGVPVKLTTDNPMLLAHSHHVVYRSAGGPDELWNLVTLSAQAHDDEHRHRIAISGNANETITITRHDPETGRVVEMWQSEVPA